MKKPDCYKCKFRTSISGDAHSKCRNPGAKVKGNPYGIRSGWFNWPLNFDPTWLESCNGYAGLKSKKKPFKSTFNVNDPLVNLLSMLR